MLESDLWSPPLYNLIPFHILKISSTPLNIYGNLLLLFPLGILLPLVHNKISTFKNLIIISFIIVMIIEITQLLGTMLIGLFGEFGYERYFDIDDFIFNLFGSSLGFLIYKKGIYPLIKFIKLDEKCNLA